MLLEQSRYFYSWYQKCVRHPQLLPFMPKPCWLSARHIWHSWTSREAGTAACSNCRSCWLSFPWPRSHLWETCSSHNQQEAKQVRNLGVCTSKYPGLQRGRKKRSKWKVWPCSAGKIWEHLAQHPMPAIPNPQCSPGTHRAAGQHSPASGDAEQGKSLPLTWEPVNKRSRAPHTCP